MDTTARSQLPFGRCLIANVSVCTALDDDYPESKQSNFCVACIFWQHVRSLSVGRQVRSASSASSVSSASRQVSEANKCVVYVRSYVCPRVVQVCSVV